MKPALTCTEWFVINEHIESATRSIAEVANLLDRRVATDQICDDTKRIETELCVLESRLRHLRKQSEFNRSAVA
jgi:hypothetical protein